MQIKEMYLYLNTDRAGFSKFYDIPEEILISWEEDNSSMPVYVKNLLLRVIKEDHKKLLKEDSLHKLYDYLGNPVSQSKWDIEFDYLKDVEDSNGEAYWIYKDEIKAAAIKIADQTLITELDKINAILEPASTDFEQLELDSILRSQSFL